MTTSISKWGNSQGIRLPKYLLEALGWSDNESIDITIQNEKLVITKSTSKRKTIEELFKDYNGDYKSELIDWGEDVGREKW